MLIDTHKTKSLAFLASAISEVHGLVVRMRGSKAYTNGKLLTLPAIDLEKTNYAQVLKQWTLKGHDPVEVAWVIINALLDHEAGHCANTDFKVVEAVKMDPLTFEFWNIIEDPRSDYIQGTKFPGCRVNFNTFDELLYSKPASMQVLEQSTSLDLLTGYPLFWLYYHKLGHTVMKQHIGPRRAILCDRFTPEFMDKLDAILRRAKDARDTAHAIELAREIVALLKEEAQKQQDQSQSSQQDDQDSQPEDSQEQQAGESGSDSDQGENSDSDEQQEDGSDSGDPESSDEGEPSEFDNDSSGKNDDAPNSEEDGADSEEPGNDSGNDSEQSESEDDESTQDSSDGGSDPSDDELDHDQEDAGDSDSTDNSQSSDEDGEEDGQSAGSGEESEQDSDPADEDQSDDSSGDESGDDSAEGDDTERERDGEGSPSDTDDSDASEEADEDQGEQGADSTEQGADGQGNGISETSEGQAPDNLDQNSSSSMEEASSQQQYPNSFEEVLDYANWEEEPQNRGELIRELVNQIAEDCILDDPECVPAIQVEYPEALVSEIDEGRVLSQSSYVSGRITSLLQSKARRPIHFKRQGRKIATRRVFRTAVKDYRIFYEERETKVPTAAIDFFVDNSGSMSLMDMELALDSVLAMGMALRNNRLFNLALTAFPGNSEMDCTTLIRHGERFHNKIGITSRGYTPLGQAVWKVLPSLLNCKEDRKIIFVIFDGGPTPLEAAIQAMEDARNNGVEAYGLGVGVAEYEYSNFIKIFGDNFRCIDSIDALGDAVFAMLEDALL